jgi:hypothetical protein
MLSAHHHPGLVLLRHQLAGQTLCFFLGIAERGAREGLDVLALQASTQELSFDPLLAPAEVNFDGSTIGPRFHMPSVKWQLPAARRLAARDV